MDNLTAQQCLAMANQLTALQTIIGNYKHTNYQKLTDQQSTNFRKTLKTLSDAGGILFAHTVTIALDEADDAISDLKDATDKINSILQTIDKIQTWVNIAAAAFNLATAIITNVPTDIAKGVAGLVKSTKSDS